MSKRRRAPSPLAVTSWFSFTSLQATSYRPSCVSKLPSVHRPPQVQRLLARSSAVGTVHAPLRVRVWICVHRDRADPAWRQLEDKEAAIADDTKVLGRRQRELALLERAELDLAPRRTRRRPQRTSVRRRGARVRVAGPRVRTEWPWNPGDGKTSGSSISHEARSRRARRRCGIRLAPPSERRKAVQGLRWSSFRLFSVSSSGVLFVVFCVVRVVFVVRCVVGVVFVVLFILWHPSYTKP